MYTAPRTHRWNPWAVAAVAWECIAYGSEHRHAPVTDRALARILGAYNDIDDPLLNDGSNASPWDYLLRTVYQQFTTSASIQPKLARAGSACRCRRPRRSRTTSLARWMFRVADAVFDRTVATPVNLSPLTGHAALT